MKKIILLGTSHSIQRGEKRYFEFNEFINDLLSTHKPLTIAEEIEDKYILANIAYSQGINHLIIEPTREKKIEIGIPDTSSIELNIFF